MGARPHPDREKRDRFFPLFQDLSRTHRLSRKTQTITPVDDKVTRFEAQTAKLETGNFLVPVEAPWLDDFRRECLAFPGGKYDDQVDSMTQFLAWTGSRRGRGFTEPRKPHPQPRSVGRRVSYW
jgi:predicted phage terminase large subunit-like protein